MLQVSNFDIRKYKTELRDNSKTFRKELDSLKKNNWDNAIFNKVVNSGEYIKSDILLTYVSTIIEVDTHNLIKRAFEDNKIVAVPKCVDGTRNMKFYIINSMDDLKPGTFSVFEPWSEKCEELNIYKNCLCIVPGLIFDMYGFRLGYGKGYYDRFLSNHNELITIGLTYCNCTVNKLQHGKYDVPIDYLVTEKYMRSFRR